VSAFEKTARREGKVLAEPRPAAADVTRPTRLAEIFAPAYRKRTILNGTLWFTVYFVSYGYSVWLPSLYVSIGGLEVSQALYLTLVVGASQLVVVYAFALAVDRMGRRRLFLAGFAVALAGAILGVVMVASGATGWPTLFAAGLLLAIGSYVPAAGLYLYIPELYPTRIRAWGTAAGSSMNRIASVIAPTVVGALLAGGLGLGSVFVMFGLVLLVGLVVMSAWGSRRRGGRWRRPVISSGDHRAMVELLRRHPRQAMTSTELATRAGLADTAELAHFLHRLGERRVGRHPRGLSGGSTSAPAMYAVALVDDESGGRDDATRRARQCATFIERQFLRAHRCR
jgi:Nitrate/nitrite transporter